MKISELKEAYYAASGTVSDIIRQISFAGIAIIWIFKIGKDESAGIAFTPEMRGPLLLFVATLFADLLQYVYKTLVWGSLNSHYWKKFKDNEADVEISESWNYPALILFWAKCLFCLAGYGALFWILYKKVM